MRRNVHVQMGGIGSFGPGECEAPVGPRDAAGTQGPELGSEACGRNTDEGAISTWQVKPGEHVVWPRASCSTPPAQFSFLCGTELW